VNSSHRLIAIAILLLSAMSLINALGPPHAWDALMYHLTSPLHHLRAGHLVVEPSLPESGYPQLVEMHYAWLLLLGAPRATAVLHGLFGILTSLLVFSLMRRWINDQAAWLTLAILYSAGTWTRLMGIAYIDLVLVFYATLAFTQLLGWMDKDDRGSTILLGVLAGFCFGVKYTGVFVGVALLILMVWRRPRKLGRIMVYFGPAAFVVALPWLLKNLQTGSLFYPFLGNGMGWDPIRRAWFSRVGTGLLHSNPIHIVTAPIMMTILGADGAQTWDANFGPLMLLLVPLLLIGWRAYRQDIWFRYGLGWAVLLYAGWLLGAAVSSLLVIPRLLFPLVPVLAMVLGASVQRLFTVELKGLSLGRITLALILVVLLLTTVSQVGNFLEDQSLEVALGWTDSEDYLYQQLGWYHGAIRSLDALPDSSQVLFLFEPRSYYCPPGRCIPDGILDRWYWYRQRGLGIQDIVNEWCGQGVTHVLLYKLGIDLLRTGDDPLSQDDWAALDQLIQAHLVEVENFGDAYILYRLSSSDPGEP
jgi:4-amino-4-deoxy-L-arabinose transferase-like glycosyltransferase